MIAPVLIDGLSKKTLTDLATIVRTTEDLYDERVSGPAVQIDEIALLVASLEAQQNIVNGFVGDHLGTFFNAAWDEPHTEPISSNYRVHYSFLQPHDWPWRIEVMRIADGVSPLHAPMVERLGGSRLATVVHASFKVHPTRYSTQRETLSRNGFKMAQECSSDYGKFSYYVPEGINWPVYLKPRINLRDSAPAPAIPVARPNIEDQWS